MTKKIHSEKIYTPLFYNEEGEGKMIEVKRKNGNRVEYKTLSSAEAFCKENKVPFIGERITSVYRVTIKK